MVRAILDNRKTQTRRIIKCSEGIVDRVRPVTSVGMGVSKGEKPTHYVLMVKDHKFNSGHPVVHCPYGQPGDHLWVKEAWSCESWGPDPKKREVIVRYAARERSDQKFLTEKQYELYGTNFEKSRSSMLMPRWASRILLEITEVRVERLQEISEEDAAREGAVSMDPAGHLCPVHTLRKCFKRIWNQIHKRSGSMWESNPWVWVISFKRINP